MSNQFPTHLSDLHLGDPTTTPNLYNTLKHLKKSTLSVHNRLRSILLDSAYVANTVHPHFPNLPLIANERCGSWYIPPDQKAGSAYFKSTDGHYGYWDFSLRRLNLQVLEMLGREGGAVLVDSTRRGKRMPDALRRTVPVWVVVWNRVLFGEELVGVEAWKWALGLQHPGLEPGEVRLIEGRVEGWVAGLKGLGLALGELRRQVGRPIRLCWVIQGEDLPDRVTECDHRSTSEVKTDECNLLVLCSASRRVIGAEMSEDGYIQGAADDAESWSGDLTSTIFWEHKDELMSVPEEELPELITRLIDEGKLANGDINAVQIRPTRNIFVAATSPQLAQNIQAAGFDMLVDCNEKAVSESPRIMNLGCRSRKLGSRDLRNKLSAAVANVSAELHKNTDSQILIVCENGKDLSIGVAVTLLCALYDEKGQLTAPYSNAANKHLVKQRLAWITAIKPEANPSRSTLQSVNSFLMS